MVQSAQHLIHQMPMYKPKYFVDSLLAVYRYAQERKLEIPPEVIEEVLELHGLHKLVSIRNAVLRAKEKARVRVRQLYAEQQELRAAFRAHPVHQECLRLRERRAALERQLQSGALPLHTELGIRREIDRLRAQECRLRRSPELRALMRRLAEIRQEIQVTTQQLAWLRRLLKMPRRVRDLATAGTGNLTPSARAAMEGEHRTFSEVAPGLFLSDDRLYRYIVPLRIGAVLSLTAEDEDSGVDQTLRWDGGRCLYHSVPLEDGKPIPPEKLDHMVAWLAHHLERGERVAIHCQAGMSRTPAVAVAYLCSTGVPFDVAWRQVKERHPIANPSRAVLESVRQWAASRFGAFSAAD